MSALHSDAPAHSLRITKRTISEAFDGMPFNEIFEEFHEKPLGVGAIAQVYKAKLNPRFAAMGDADMSKEEQTLGQMVKKNVDALAKSSPQRVPSSYVAIKVLHPNIERIVRRDLKIMGFFAAIINAIPTMGWLSFPDQVEQFGEMMRLQLDLRIESANLSMFRKYFKDRTTAWFPFPYTEYSTRQVLIEEYANGIPLAAFLEDGGGVFQKEIADEGLDAFLHMLLIDNFIHADLHPGNIMVRFYKPAAVPGAMSFFSRTRAAINPSSPPQSTATDAAEDTDVTEQVLQRVRPHRGNPTAWAAELARIDAEGYRPQLIFIDTGLVTELNHANRQNFLDLFKAVAEFDGYKAGHLMIERCRQPDAVIDREVFALRMQHLVLGVKSQTFALGSIKIGDVLSEVLDMVRSHHVRLEGDFVNVVLSILLLEGIGRSLDPDLDLFAGYVTRILFFFVLWASPCFSFADAFLLQGSADLATPRRAGRHFDAAQRRLLHDQGLGGTGGAQARHRVGRRGPSFPPPSPLMCGFGEPKTLEKEKANCSFFWLRSNDASSTISCRPTYEKGDTSLSPLRN